MEAPDRQPPVAGLVRGRGAGLGCHGVERARAGLGRPADRGTRVLGLHCAGVARADAGDQRRAGQRGPFDSIDDRALGRGRDDRDGRQQRDAGAGPVGGNRGGRRRGPVQLRADPAAAHSADHRHARGVADRDVGGHQRRARAQGQAPCAVLGPDGAAPARRSAGGDRGAGGHRGDRGDAGAHGARALDCSGGPEPPRRAARGPRGGAHAAPGLCDLRRDSQASRAR
jgi:hypothetical protein